MRKHKLRSVSMVKVRDALSRELEMLRLVFTNWDMCCPFSHISFISLSNPPLPPKQEGDTYLCTKISAACKTGYEKRPSFNLPFPFSSSGLASSFNSSLLYSTLTNNSTRKNYQKRTFHCVILPRYPILAVQLKIHISSACCLT